MSRQLIAVSLLLIVSTSLLAQDEKNKPAQPTPKQLAAQVDPEVILVLESQHIDPGAVIFQSNCRSKR